MSAFTDDLRYSWRGLRRDRGFAAIAVLTLALGIGASVTMFAFVQDIVLGQNAVREAGRVATLWAVNQRTGADRVRVAPANYLDWKRQARSWESLTAFRFEELLLEAGSARHVSVQFVTPDFLPMMRVSPILGRGFREEDAQSGAPVVVVLSESFWRTQFGGDPNVLGRRLRLEGRDCDVVGVVPTLDYPGTVPLYLPLVLDNPADRTTPSLTVMGRLRPGVSIEQAQAELDRITDQLDKQYPATNAGWRARAVTVAFEQNKRKYLAFGFALGPVFCVLLIGCCNVINLLLARGVARQTEFAVRAALGATPGRLLRYCLAESLLLALGGGVLGVALARAGLIALRNAFLETSPDAAEHIRFDGRVVLAAALLTLVAPLLFGLYPALRASGAAMAGALKQAGGQSGARISWRKLPLTSLEVSLAVVLVLVTVLFTRSFANLESTLGPAVDADRLVLVPGVPAGRVAELQQRLQSVPGVTSTGVAEAIQFFPRDAPGEALTLERDGAAVQIRAVRMQVGAGFFRALAVPFVSGSGFDDHAAAASAAVISESLARKFGGDTSHLRIRVGGNSVPISGVVRDWLRDPTNGEPSPTVYLPLTGRASKLTIIARTAGTASWVVPGIRREIVAFDRKIPVEDSGALDDLFAAEFRQGVILISCIGVFAAIALILAAAGVYGVMAFSVARRTREMGIRVALGAVPRRLFAMVLTDALRIVAAGSAIGLLLGVGAVRLIAHELVGVTPADPRAIVFCCLLLLLTGCVAAFLPARRATRVDPMVALRSE